MDLLEKDSMPLVNYCEWCYGVGKSLCGRCHVVSYCCRDHQIQHWPAHKKVCKKSQPMSSIVPHISAPSTSDSFSQMDGWSQNSIVVYDKNPVTNTLIPNAYGSENHNIMSARNIEMNIPNEDEIFSTLSSELLSSDNNFWELINSCDMQTVSDIGSFLKGSINEILRTQTEFSSNSEANGNSEPIFVEEPHFILCATPNDICANIVKDLNKYGICVLDKFIGSDYGTLVLEEVKSLYHTGIFKKGELVNPNPYASKDSIRNDVITWVNGSEPGCKYIGSLMKLLDCIVTTCNKMPKNGILSQYKLHRRTKAMIACYPGDGTYYKKHIDNPHKDGRCITCIYYLNKNWNTKIHGGLLRMFPAAHDSQIANIEPIFDRMIFFWSDKRNPHEVLPAFATRFAITVWYFDADERDRALMMSRDRALKYRNQQFMKK